MNEVSSPIPYVYRAYVTRVIDGDTVVVNIDLGLNVWKHGIHVRLLGVLAPELYCPGSLRCKAYLEQLVLFDWKRMLESKLVIKTQKDKGDKYGRLLGEIWVDGRSVNLDMQRYIEEEQRTSNG